MSNSS